MAQAVLLFKKYYVETVTILLSIINHKPLFTKIII